MNYLNQVPAALGVGKSPCTSRKDSDGPGGSRCPRDKPAGCPPGDLAPASLPLCLCHREGRPVPCLSSPLLPPCPPLAPSHCSQPLCSSPAPAAGSL